MLSVEAMSRTEVEKHTVFELNNLLTSSKEIFTDSKSTKALVDHMKFIVESHSQLDSDQCDSINNCLLLIRNILHVPENKAPASNGALGHTSMQNQIMWNLFTQNIDKIIIYLMSCPQKVSYTPSLFNRIIEIKLKNTELLIPFKLPSNHVLCKMHLFFSLQHIVIDVPTSKKPTVLQNVSAI